MSLWTAKFTRAGAPVTIPGLNFIPHEAEGFLDFYFGPNDARTIPLLYDCGPYTATVFKDGTQFGSPVDIPNHFWRACWWLDIAPITPASIIRPAALLISSGLVPPFGDTGIPVTWPVSGSMIFPGPMKFITGEAGYEPTTGGRPGIGIVTAAVAAWLAGKGDAQNMLAIAQETAVQPIWDYDAGKPIDLIAHPKTTTYSTSAQGGPPDWRGPFPQDPQWIRPVPNPLPPSNPSEPQTAHMEEVCGVVALATGQGRYIRALQMRVVKGFDEDNAGVGMFGAASVFNCEMRGMAWLFRQLFYCYWATKLAEDAGNLPADCLPSSIFKQMIDNQAAQFHKYIETAPFFKIFGTIYGGAIAWWQCDMVTQALCLYAGKWPTEWGPILIKVFKNLAARVNADGLNQWKVAVPSWYWGALGPVVNNDPNNIPVPYSGFPELWDKWSKGQAAGNDNRGNNGWLTAAQVAILNNDPTNNSTYINPTEYESWTLGALAFVVSLNRGVLAGAVSAEYPNLEGSYSQQYAMMKKWVTTAGGYFLAQCSIVATPQPYTPPPVVAPPPVVVPPVVTPPPDTSPPTGEITVPDPVLNAPFTATVSFKDNLGNAVVPDTVSWSARDGLKLTGDQANKFVAHGVYGVAGPSVIKATGAKAGISVTVTKEVTVPAAVPFLASGAITLS